MIPETPASWGNPYKEAGARRTSQEDRQKWQSHIWRSICCSAFAVADVEPAGAVTLPASFFILSSRSDAGRAGFPIGFARCASNYARASLPRGHLRALAVDLVRGIRDGPAACTDRNGLRFLATPLVRFGVGFGFEHGFAQAQAVQMLGIRIIQGVQLSLDYRIPQAHTKRPKGQAAIPVPRTQGRSDAYLPQAGGS